MKNEWILYLLIATIITNIPIIGKYVSVFNTLLHEFGHSLVAFVLGGRVQSISLFTNTEGVATTANSSWLARRLTSLAGYPFASASGYAMIWAIKHGYENIVLYVMFGILVFTFVFWIRNFYGLLWVVSFGALMFYYILNGNPLFKEPFLYFMTSIVYVQSLYSALVILYLSGTNPKASGDAHNLAKGTLIIPSFVWGLLFACQAFYFAYMGFRLMMS